MKHSEVCCRNRGYYFEVCFRIEIKYVIRLVVKEEVLENVLVIEMMKSVMIVKIEYVTVATRVKIVQVKDVVIEIEYVNHLVVKEEVLENVLVIETYMTATVATSCVKKIQMKVQCKHRRQEYQY